MIPRIVVAGRTPGMWLHKWSRKRILVSLAGRLEPVDVPVYKSTGGRLFKTLLSSACRMDCLYCPLRRGTPLPRERWEPHKLVEVFRKAYESGIVSGLFLTSSLYNDPDMVVEEMLEVVDQLRRRGYKGYIHLRLMPGVSAPLAREALRHVDRVGLNLEAPTASAFAEIAPSKGDWLQDIYVKLVYLARNARKPGMVDTQLVVGASEETDREILILLENLARHGIGVVHFSPYTPIPGTPLASKRRQTPAKRTHLLYQAWRLIRDYGYKLQDILPGLDDNDNLPLHVRDLKEYLASKHPEWYPVDPNTAKPHELLRVPGIGPQTAKKILKLRQKATITAARLAEIMPRHQLKKALPYLAL